MRKSVIFVIGFLLSALVIAGVWLACRNDGRESPAAELGRHCEAKRSHAIRETKPSRGQKLVRGKLQLAIEEDEDLSPTEKALMERIEKALDEENLKTAMRCADEARKCPNADVRRAMVDTLGFFGAKALPELTSFLADADEDVRGAACCEWSSAVSDIEDEREKVSVVEMAMGVISDEDFLEDISSEYIGVDEKIAVESLMRVIADGKSEQGVAKAKETYEFVTGEEYSNVQAAEAWLKENYTPPE